MASGKHHALATLALTPLTAFVTWELSGGDPAVAALAGLGCLSGIFISPDLDLSRETISESILTRSIFVVGALWIALWLPYSWIAQHRGLSHTPILGTMGRVVYLAVFCMLIHITLRGLLPFDLVAWGGAYWPQLLIFAAGLAVADVAHWAMDGFLIL